MRLADYVMNRLSAAGIRQVFLVTGRGALFLSDALAKHPELEPVSVHHEQSAAFAAVAYAQQSQGLGACLVSTGCASTNTITGVLSAWQDGVPCVVISGQNILKETTRHTGIPLRTYGQQEADIIEMVRPITKFATMITEPQEIRAAMDTALRLANTGRKGPVWIDIPLDLQSAQIEPDTLRAEIVPETGGAALNDVQFASVLEDLRQAKRPVVLLGSGIRSAGAEYAFRTFAESWRLPVTFTASAPDTYGSAMPQSIGSVGSMGCSRAGNFAVQNSDFLLILGSRLTSLTTGPEFCKFARAAKVVVVDIDPVEHSKETIRIDTLVHADLLDFLTRVNQMQAYPADSVWLQKCQEWKTVFGGVEPVFQSGDAVDLYELADCLGEALPRNSALVTDSGLIEVILPTNVRFKDGVHCIHPASQGAMGFALPAAIGAHYAGAQLTLAVIGDGSIMMNIQELETIRHRKLPIKIIVVNNNVYSIIRRRQRDLFRKRIIGTDPDNGISCPDFEKVATCFDFDYIKIEKTSQLRSEIKGLLNKDGPVICEIMGRPDQEYIELGQTRSEINHRMVRRPLEDQIPFLDRALFLSQMLVDPIDQ